MHKFPAQAEYITKEEAERHIRAYAGRNPFAFKQLGSMLIGDGTRDTETVIRAFVESIPFVKFSPIRADSR